MRSRAFSILLICLISLVSLMPFAAAPAAAQTDPAPPDSAPPVTVNEFFPELRPLGDCVSSLPKPNCGSEARGGWEQTTIAIVLVGGLAFITWRVVRAARASNRNAGEVRSGG